MIPPAPRSYRGGRSTRCDACGPATGCRRPPVEPRSRSARRARARWGRWRVCPGPGTSTAGRTGAISRHGGDVNGDHHAEPGPGPPQQPVLPGTRRSENVPGGSMRGAHCPVQSPAALLQTWPSVRAAGDRSSPRGLSQRPEPVPVSSRPEHFPATQPQAACCGVSYEVPGAGADRPGPQIDFVDEADSRDAPARRARTLPRCGPGAAPRPPRPARAATTTPPGKSPRRPPPPSRHRRLSPD